MSGGSTAGRAREKVPVLSPVPQHVGKPSRIERTVRNPQPDRGRARAEINGGQGYVENAVPGKSPVTTGQSRRSTVSRSVKGKGANPIP